MEEPSNGSPSAEAEQVNRFTRETIAARQARVLAWVLIACGVLALLLGGAFYAGKQSGYDVVATVTHTGPCTSDGICTVNVAYDAAGAQYTALMHGVPSDEIYGSPAHRLLNINYAYPGDPSPTDNDMPDAVWIGFLAGGLAFAGSGVAVRWRKGSRPRLVVTADKAVTGAVVPPTVSPATRGLHPDPGGQPGLRRWDGKEWSPFLLRADLADGGPAGAKAPAEMWSPLPGSEPQWVHVAAKARRAGIVLASCMAVTAIAAIVTAALYARDLTNPQADYTLAAFALRATGLALLITCTAWARRARLKKIERAGKAAAGLAADGDSPAGSQAVQVRCLECGAQSGLAAELCARCGAPLN